jgi:hypothetical protein
MKAADRKRRFMVGSFFDDSVCLVVIVYILCVRDLQFADRSEWDSTIPDSTRDSTDVEFDKKLLMFLDFWACRTHTQIIHVEINSTIVLTYDDELLLSEFMTSFSRVYFCPH